MRHIHAALRKSGGATVAGAGSSRCRQTPGPLRGRAAGSRSRTPPPPGPAWLLPPLHFLGHPAETGPQQRLQSSAPIWNRFGNEAGLWGSGVCSSGSGTGEEAAPPWKRSAPCCWAGAGSCRASSCSASSRREALWVWVWSPSGPQALTCCSGLQLHSRVCFPLWSLFWTGAR